MQNTSHVTNCLLMGLQGGMLPYGYFLDPSLPLTISPLISPSPTSTPDFHPYNVSLSPLSYEFLLTPPTLKTSSYEHFLGSWLL